MIRSTVRRSNRARRCVNGHPIAQGERYLSSVASPDHDDLNNNTWWRLDECRACCEQYGRWPTESAEVTS